MKYFILMALFSISCTNRSQQENPQCLSGYFAFNTKGEVVGFCRKVSFEKEGIRGFSCYDTPGLPSGRGIESWLLLKEGSVAETKCYNVLSGVK